MFVSADLIENFTLGDKMIKFVLFTMAWSICAILAIFIMSWKDNSPAVVILLILAFIFGVASEQ
jgi:hypothetical protein